MRALQEKRERAIGPLVEALAKRSRLLAELAALDASYGKAYVEAEAAGWTQEELAQLGADVPAKRPRTRRKRSTARGKSAEQSPVAPQTAVRAAEVSGGQPSAGVAVSV